MASNYFEIHRYKAPMLPLQIGSFVAEPIIAYLIWPIVGLPGVLVILVFWLLTFWGLILHFKASKEKVVISDSGISIYQSSTPITFFWNEINKTGFQGVTAKRMGAYETFGYLVIQIGDIALNKLSQIKSSSEFGFIHKKEDLNNYMGPTKMDLYLNMAYANDQDFKMTELLSSKSDFTKTLPPLVKTLNQSEYDEVAKNFEQQV